MYAHLEFLWHISHSYHSYNSPWITFLKRLFPAQRSLQLRSLAAALRKGDDPQGVLAALSRLEVLVRARPWELGQAAPELVRALMHCRVPEWAEAEAKR